MKKLRAKIFRYIKWTFNFFYNHFIYFRNRKSLSLKSPDPISKPIVLINLRTNIIRDSITTLVIWYIRAGYKVYLKDSFLFIGSMSKPDRLIFELPDCHFVRKIPRDVFLYLTNKSESINCKFKLHVTNDYWKPDDEFSIHLPEGMHPIMYYRNYIPDLSKIRKKGVRRIGIFFSGNLDPDIYNLEIIRSKFKILTRLEIVEYLKSHLKDSIIIPDNENELLTGDFTEKLVINEYRNVNIKQEDFINFLTNCNFFLFTPGVAIPLCRNNFEAMAAGCIPVLQYAHYHYPPLEHGKNCIVFNSKNDLIDKINMALNMDEEMISEMRDEVIKYYDQNIDEKVIIKNIDLRLKEGNLKQILILQG